MPFNVGPLELIIVLVIVLVIFGPKRLPGLGRSLGSGMREFRDSISGKGGDAAKPDEAAVKPDVAAAKPERLDASQESDAGAREAADAVEEPVPGERSR